jgi:predicted transcriptional regulator
MPITKDSFAEGATPRRKKLQVNVMKVLQKNPQVAISSIEFERILNARRQAINQALRALEQKGMVERAYIKEGPRSVTYVTIKEAWKLVDIATIL